MMLTIQKVGIDGLPAFASIPISFLVESIFRIEAVDRGLAGFRLREEKVDPPYLKDYDAGGCNGSPETPLDWPRLFDISNWGIFLACEGEPPLGGAAVALHSAGVNMLEDRRELAVLWDIRVRPENRGQGIWQQLFRHAADWARGQGCRQLKIETQNVNVPACRFYARQGCTLGGINRFGYAGCPSVAHEAMLLWYLDLYK
jgi:ribosomal protein S18 acetylase RimI-like enzyme